MIVKSIQIYFNLKQSPRGSRIRVLPVNKLLPLRSNDLYDPLLEVGKCLTLRGKVYSVLKLSSVGVLSVARSLKECVYVLHALRVKDT